MESLPDFQHFSDSELAAGLSRLVSGERGATARLLACLAEFDRRRLYLSEGFSSLFIYCRDKLHLGDGAAYRRIEAARAFRRFPVILGLIAEGAVTLTNLGLISPHLTAANHHDLLAEITHKKKTDVAIIVARLKPKPDVPTMIRKLRTTQGSKAAESSAIVAAVNLEPAEAAAQPPEPTPNTIRRPVIAPLAPERFKLQITMSQETHDTLRQLQDLMRHSIPSGDAALIVDRALKLLLEEVLRRKCGALKRPRKESAQPASARPEVPAGLFH